MLRIFRYIKRTIFAIHEKLFAKHSPSKQWVQLDKHHKDE